MSKLSSKKSLSARTKFIVGVISFKDTELFELPTDELRNYFNACANQWAFIPHWLDVDENGEFKTLHIHFVADLIKSTRLRTTLNQIADICGENPLAVSIEQYTNFESCIQYLVHRNDEDKVQYCSWLITTNLSHKDLIATLNADIFVMDAQRLYDVVSNAEAKSDILKALGLFYYHRYRGVINDVWLETHKGGYPSSKYLDKVVNA